MMRKFNSQKDQNKPFLLFLCFLFHSNFKYSIISCFPVLPTEKLMISTFPIKTHKKHGKIHYFNLSYDGII